MLSLKILPAEDVAMVRGALVALIELEPDMKMVSAVDRGGEHEVLRFAATGAQSAEIARSLHLSVGTVRNYLTTIVAKLNARNRLDAVRTRARGGLAAVIRAPMVSALS